MVQQTVENAVVQSKPFASLIGVPTSARILVQVLSAAPITDPPVVGTDMKFSISRNNGATFTEDSLSLVSAVGDGVPIYEGTISLAGQPSGTSLVWKLESFNNKDFRFAGVYFAWGE